MKPPLPPAPPLHRPWTERHSSLLFCSSIGMTIWQKWLKRGQMFVNSTTDSHQSPGLTSRYTGYFTDLMKENDKKGSVIFHMSTTTVQTHTLHSCKLLNSLYIREQCLAHVFHTLYSFMNQTTIVDTKVLVTHWYAGLRVRNCPTYPCSYLMICFILVKIFMKTIDVDT